MDCSKIELSMDEELGSIDERCSICSIVHDKSTIDSSCTISLTSISSEEIIPELGRSKEDEASVCSEYAETVEVSEKSIKYGILPIAIDIYASYNNNVFDIQRRTIKPFELSTLKNESIICGMTSNDLKRSVIEIWSLSKVHDYERRVLYPSWYNWVLLDLARRLHELDNRILSTDLINGVKLEICQRLFC
ncbi:MAG: hypothetical protein EXX96DRAFT_572014, partial [Benjaminiella poitrasii]